MVDWLEYSDFIREDEEFTNYERDDEVCCCDVCGQPLYYGDHATGIVDRGTKIIICEDCASTKLDLEDWLGILQLNAYNGEVGRVDRWTYGEIDRQAQRMVLLMGGGKHE